MILVTFALPEESRDFRRALRQTRTVRTAGCKMIAGTSGQQDVTLLHTGVGAASATAQVREAIAVIRPRFVVASGFAGGLQPELGLADLIIATNVSTPSLLSRCREIVGHRRVFYGPLISAPHPLEAPAEKATLGTSSGALAVDMETDAIASICAASQVPLLALRAISDTVRDSLPVPFRCWFDLERQRPRILPLLYFLAMHPQRIAPFAVFVRNLAPARIALADGLTRFFSGDTV